MKTALVLVLVALVGSAGALGERGHERGVMEHAPPKPPPPRNAVPFSPPHTSLLAYIPSPLARH